MVSGILGLGLEGLEFRAVWWFLLSVYYLVLPELTNCVNDSGVDFGFEFFGWVPKVGRLGVGFRIQSSGFRVLVVCFMCWMVGFMRCFSRPQQFGIEVQIDP